MSLKASDFLKKLDDRHPHMTLDVEFDGEELPLVFRNLLRLDDDEQQEVSEAMSILSLAGVEDEDVSELGAQELLDSILTKEEQDQNFTRVYVERIVRALGAAAEDKELYQEFIEGSRTKLKGDFKQFVISIFNGYAEETRLGEAVSSEAS